jgi:TM2 domain-containing membrane protein YozV
MYGPEGSQHNRVCYGYTEVPYPTKSKFAALLLCLFGGYLGLHRFYVGKVGTGLIWFFTMGFFTLGWFVDLLLIILGWFRDKHGRLLD